MDKKYVFAYVSEELHQKLREYCVKNKITAVKLLTKLIEKEIAKKGK